MHIYEFLHFCYFLYTLDIDECEDRNSTCHGLTRCVNTKGSYKCELHPLWFTVLGMYLFDSSLLLFLYYFILYAFKIKKTLTRKIYTLKKYKGSEIAI